MYTRLRNARILCFCSFFLRELPFLTPCLPFKTRDTLWPSCNGNSELSLCTRELTIDENGCVLLLPALRISDSAGYITLLSN